MRRDVLCHVAQTAQPQRQRVAVHPGVGAVVEVADEIDVRIAAGSECFGHLDGQVASAHHDRGAARSGMGRLVAQDGAPQSRRQPLQYRRGEKPGHQDVVFEVMQAACRVAAQQQDGGECQPAAEDIDSGCECVVAKPVRARKGECEHEQAQRQRRAIHRLVEGQGRDEESANGDAGFEKRCDQRSHRLRGAEERSGIGAVLKHCLRRMPVQSAARTLVRLAPPCDGRRKR